MQRKDEREILIATVIGDGCLVHHSKQGSCWLKLSHTPAQRDYLEWKVALIESLPRLKGRKFTVRERLNKHSNGKSYPVVTANVYGVKYFRVLREWIYPHGVKTCERVLKYLKSPLALAILMMDDGTEHRRKRQHKDGSAYFLSPRLQWCLCRPEEECLLAMGWLATTFGVQAYPVRNSRKDAPVTYYVLNFNVENSQKVWSVIAPFVSKISSMREKFRLCIERYAST